MLGESLGTLFVSISADLSELEAGMVKAQGVVTGFQQKAVASTAAVEEAMLGFAVAAAGALTAAAVATAKFAESVEKMSQQTGIAVEQLQKLEYAGKLNALSADQLSTGLRFLTRNMEQVALGNSTVSRAFRELGVSALDATGNLRPTNDVLLDLADRFARMPDGAQKAGLAIQIFGRSGTAMIPILNQGRDGLKALGDEAVRMGDVMSSKDIASATEFNQSIERLQAAFQGLVHELGIEFIPVLEKIVSMVTQAVAAFNRFEQATHFLQGAFAAIKSAANIVGGGAYGAVSGGTASMVSSIFGTPQQVNTAVEGVAKLGKQIGDLVQPINQAATAASKFVTGFANGVDRLREDSLKKYGKEFGNLSNFVENATVEMGKAIETNLSSALSDVITGAKSAGQAFADFGKALLKALVDFVVQYLVNLAVTRAAAALATAFSEGLAFALADAWAAPAFFASVATLGGAVAAGESALASGLIATKALSKFAEGGIVNRPTIAMIGEAGPEAVVPLSRPGVFGGAQFGGNTVHVQIVVQGGLNATRAEAEQFSRTLGILTQDKLKKVNV